MRSSAVLALAVASSLSLVACVDDGGFDPTQTDEVEPADDKADTLADLQLRVGETTLWVDRVLARKVEGGRTSWVLHGRTSRNLIDGDNRAYIFDDILGDFVLRGPRSFDVQYGVTSSGPMLDGVNLFLGFGFVPSAGRPDHLTARAIVRPRLGTTSGSSSLAFTAELTPTVIAGRIVYRLQGRSTKPLTAVSATVGAGAATATLVDATHFQIDLTRAQIIEQAGVTGTPIVVTAQAATGALVRKAGLTLSIKKLGLTAGDAYETWPVPTCTAATRTCLTSQPAGTIDLGGCGDALTVNACAREVGAFVDSAVLTAARASFDYKLAAVEGDAAGLVGGDRAGGFAAAVRAKGAAAIDDQGGRWYLSAATRDGAVTAAIDATVDGAYARPLAYSAVHAPAPGDAAATRQVAADALLAQLAVQDFVHSGLGRTLEQLTRELRAQHVASVRAFRDGAGIELFADGGNDIFIGAWLGLHTEVTIERATGVATRVLVEID